MIRLMHSVAWNLVLSEISLRSSGAPLLFTEYYLQDCKANLDLLQEEAVEVEVSKSSISHCKIESIVNKTLMAQQCLGGS